MSRFSLLFSIIALLLSSPVRAEQPPEFQIGVCTHFIQGKGIPENNLALISAAGAGAIRDEVPWAACEWNKNIFKIPQVFDNYLDKAIEHRLFPLIVLDYGNRNYDGGNFPRSAEAVEGFARYAERVARHAGTRVSLYQVWNEWDGGCGMPGFGKGDAESYVKLLAAVYPRLKKAAPHAEIVANSVCTGDMFFEKTLRLGVMKHCDALALHTYNYSEFQTNTPEAWLRRMNGIRDMIRLYNDGKDKPLYVTEMGWPNHLDYNGTDEVTGTAKLVRLYLLARTLPFVRGIWWYDFQDDGWDPKEKEHNFGLVRADLTPKRPYHALKDISHLVQFGEFIDMPETGDPGMYFLRFRDEGKDVWALWNVSQEYDIQLLLKSSAGQPEALTAQFPGHPAYLLNWGYREERQPVQPGMVSVTLGELPLLLKGDLSAVTIEKVIRRPFPRHSAGQRPAQNSRAAKPAAESSPSATTIHSGEEYEISGEASYQPQEGFAYGGAQDLSARFRVDHDRDYLYLTFAVTDDVPHQQEAVSELWKGDSLQLGFRISLPDAPLMARTELDAALTPDNPAVYLRESQAGFPVGKITLPELTVKRDGNITNCKLKIPAKLLGTKAFEPSARIGFSLVINDNDGKGRKGFLYRGNGIGVGEKDPRRYGTLILK